MIRTSVVILIVLSMQNVTRNVQTAPSNVKTRVKIARNNVKLRKKDSHR